ncbi:AAA family ATPase [Embleya sp. NBC_00896]|uniref:AAA family ATPase n=1 Tax=Embleya sp. NBC_00896 TaxID=2975961 RepID=UPI00386B787D|nr:AAA family ATPase [Embleya sp. NBC_00896]
MDAYVAGEYGQAEVQFRAAVEADPAMADAWLGLHALKVDVAAAVVAMHINRERFGEQRAKYGRPLNSWYWLGWWVQLVLETPRDLALAHASHWLDGRHLPELDAALALCPPAEQDAATRFLLACRAYLGKDWQQLLRHTAGLDDDALLGVEAGLFAGMARVRLGLYAKAEQVLATALVRCRSEHPQRKELRYWLARAYEETGRTPAALPLYRAVHQADPSFMDTTARLSSLAAGEPLDEYGGVTARLAGPVVGRGPLPDVLPPVSATAPPPPGIPPTAEVEHEPDPVPDPGDEEPEADVDVRVAVGPAPMRAEAAPEELALVLHELESMVGLEPVKRQVRALSAQMRMARLREAQGLPAQAPKRHFVFSGPSGTGKTTVARLLGRVFAALGLLESDRLVEAQRSDLVGEYLGQTAVKTSELIDSALGGVLFVDEAYGLTNVGYSKGDAYGDEALQVLLKRAEDDRDRLVIILAGYPEGMDRLLTSNPGLSSRFTTRVEFPSYGAEDLARIAEVMATGGGDSWDEDAAAELRSITAHVREQGWIDELGNARFVRTLYEKCCMYRDVRLVELPDGPDLAELTTLRLSDLFQAYGDLADGRG